MVSVIKRMSKLKTRVSIQKPSTRDTPTDRLLQLLDIRLGPGAAIISPKVKRIHLAFAPTINDGHGGARTFWRENLPRLKYHNPAIPMTTDRTGIKTGPATLTITFASAPSPSSSKKPSATPASDPPAPATIPSSSEATSGTTKTIEMKHKSALDILSEFMVLTQATRVAATIAEAEELHELAEGRRRSITDAKLQAKLIAKRKKEAGILTQAKKSIA